MNNSEWAAFGGRAPVEPAYVRQMSEVSSWKSLALCVGIYVSTGALAWVGSQHWLLAIAAILVIAGLQNHLLILLHEGAHRLLHPNLFWNDLMADVFCAVPFFSLVKYYRLFHLDHHRNSSDDEKDPEVEFYASQGYDYTRRPPIALAVMMVKDLCGYNLVKFMIKLNLYILKNQKMGRVEGINLRDCALYVVVWGSVIAVGWRFGILPQILLFWLLPQLAILFFLLKMHGYGEHTGLKGPTEFQRTWVHDFHPVTNFFYYPIKSGFHLEHHLFPSIPWYRMEAFRAKLLQNEVYAELAEPVTVDGFFFGKKTILRAMLLGEGFYGTQNILKTETAIP